MMIVRKKGETNKQWAIRCQEYAKKMIQVNRELYEQNQQLAKAQGAVNPRTMIDYKVEARKMFNTLAVAEHFLRQNMKEEATTIIREQLQEFGFDLTDIYEDKCIKDGAYDDSGA